MSFKPTGVRLVPEMAQIFRVERGPFISSTDWPVWMRWNWCKASDVIQLINREYNLKWKKRDLLTRFAFERDQVRGTEYAVTRPPMCVLVTTERWPHTFMEYKTSLLPELEKADKDFFVPTGWVKDVLWALTNGCTRFKVEENQFSSSSKYKRVVGATKEDGQGVYYV